MTNENKQIQDSVHRPSQTLIGPISYIIFILILILFDTVLLDPFGVAFWLLLVVGCIGGMLYARRQYRSWSKYIEATRTVMAKPRNRGIEIIGLIIMIAFILLFNRVVRFVDRALIDGIIGLSFGALIGLCAWPLWLSRHKENR